MNCRDIKPLLLAEPDGVLTSKQHTGLEQHVAVCPACRQMRARLSQTLVAFQIDAAAIALPDVDEEWRHLQARLHEPARPAKKRVLMPVIGFGSALAAAAALALAYLNHSPRPKPAEIYSPDNQVAEAEFVEAGDVNASTLVYVDKESGWLVVWATDVDTATKG